MVRVQIPATVGGRWFGGVGPNEEGEATETRRLEAEEEFYDDGEGDFEDDDALTPASSPNVTSPTGTFPQSPTFEYRLPPRPETYIQATVDYPFTSTMPTTDLTTPTTQNLQGSPVGQLPVEVLLTIMQFALDPDNTYDTLTYTENQDWNPDTMPLGWEKHSTPISGDDGSIGFRIVRRETQMSQVCGKWRDTFLTGYVVC